MEIKNKSWFLAFIAIFLGFSTYKEFDFEQLRFKSNVGFVYLVTSITATYWFFKPPKSGK